MLPEVFMARSSIEVAWSQGPISPTVRRFFSILMSQSKLLVAPLSWNFLAPFCENFFTPYFVNV